VKRYLVLALLAIPLLLYAQDKGLDLPVDRDRAEDQPSQPPQEDPTDNPVDTPPPTFWGEVMEGQNVTYVLDRSCSMRSSHTEGATRILVAQREINASLGRLPPEYKFNVISFDTQRSWFSDRLVDASPGNVAAAQSWVSNQSPRGGTDTGQAVCLALTDPEVDYIVVATDGSPSVGPEYHLEMVRRHNTRGVRIDTVGIFTDKNTSKFTGPNAHMTPEWFCQQLAAQNGGTYVKR
jgi:hypothetical protein